MKQERLSAIGEAMSGATYEISAPLQSLIGLVELLQHRPLDADARRELDRMHTEVDRAGRIIRALQVFVRRAPYDRQPIDLNDTARKAIALRRHELARRGIRVHDGCAPHLPAVFATGDDLQQVVWQLVVNAEDAMADGGGTLTLRTAANPCEHTVVVEVANDGPGIPAHAADRVFEPFDSTKREVSAKDLGSRLRSASSWRTAARWNSCLPIVARAFASRCQPPTPRRMASDVLACTILACV